MASNLIANRYEVFQHIGQGGMADVFLAVDTILNRQVAIKILRSELCTDAVSVLRFEREAQAATALAHPNIVEIYDVGEYKGHHYIVMEYVSGKPLKKVIQQRGALLTEEAIDIMKQLTAATAEAHRRGIIHRDIKPQNVIVKSDGSIKMLDFGIALAKGSMQLTQANNVMGSVHYLAPELAKGEPATPQSDIYALGIVLFEMLTGDVPFKAEQAVQVALKQMHDPMPDVRSINPEIPQSVENIVIRATAKNPELRYTSCNEMLEDLRTCLRPNRRSERKIDLDYNQRLLDYERRKNQTPTMAQPKPQTAAPRAEGRQPSSEQTRKPFYQETVRRREKDPARDPRRAREQQHVREAGRMKNVDPDLAKTATTSSFSNTVLREPERSLPEYESGGSAVQRKPKGNRVLQAVLIVLLALLSVSALYFGLHASGILNPTAKTVEVPQIIGKTLTDAKALCTDNSLVLDTSNVEYTLTENVEKGQIISCSPDVGEEVEKGSRVSVVVSSGIGVKVPNFAGRKVSDVIRELSEYSYLKVTTKEEESDTVAAGNVIRQELLEPDSMFNPNNVSEIVLVYASYPTITIPMEIIGMPVEDASSILEAMGVEVFSSTLDTTDLSEEEIASLNTGVVIRCDPDAGSEYTQKEDNYVVLYYY